MAGAGHPASGIMQSTAFPSCPPVLAPNPSHPPNLLPCSGHNWGKLAVEGGSLAFRVGGRSAFTLPLPDVSQAQQGREEVMLEFPIDDTVAGGCCDVPR